MLELPLIYTDTDHACLQHVLTSAWGTEESLWLAHFLSVLQIQVQTCKSCRWKGHLDWTYQEKLSLFGRAKAVQQEQFLVDVFKVLCSNAVSLPFF